MDWKVTRMPLNGPEWRERNLMQYMGVAPDFFLVREILRKSKLKTATRFEKAFGLPDSTVKKYLLGMRDLPARYWHLFYEFDNLHKLRRQQDKKEKLRKEPLPQKEVKESNKKLIDEFKQRLHS